MKSRRWVCCCFAVSVIAVMLATGVTAQAPVKGAAGQKQTSPGEEKSKAKEYAKVYCAESSAAIRKLMVMALDCNAVCDNVYREYPCDLQQRLNEGWKITSVAVSTVEVVRDPCECKVTGTESILER